MFVSERLEKTGKDVVERRKFIYVRIGKNASTSVREALKEKLPTGTWKVYKNTLTMKRVLLGGKHKTIKDKLENCFKFAFVRNPYDRLVSYYEYNMRVKIRKGETILNDTFYDFIKAKWECGTWQLNQYNWITSQENPDKILVDYVGRFENLQNDFNYACEKIGIIAKLSHFNMSKTRKPYQEYYDGKTRKLVSDICKKDLELFDYKF